MQNSKNNPSTLVRQVTQKEKALIDFLNEYGAKAIVSSLRSVHDIALYHSELTIDQKEKQELFDVKLLADELDKVG